MLIKFAKSSCYEKTIARQGWKQTTAARFEQLLRSWKSAITAVWIIGEQFFLIAELRKRTSW